MPGPLLGLTIDTGIKKGFKGGIMIALGHALLDLLTMILLMLGLKELMTNSMVTAFIGVFGGGVLVYMGITMVIQVHKNQVSLDTVESEGLNTKWHYLMIKGATVSISNPYYIIWWASVGLALVLSATSLGFIGVVLVYLGHITSDLVWFGFVAYTMHKSQKIMSPKVYKGIILGIGLFVACFGLYFVATGIGIVV
jgi:threonine/homoserine/homoserine lactone efflux protein